MTTKRVSTRKAEAIKTVKWESSDTFYMKRSLAHIQRKLDRISELSHRLEVEAPDLTTAELITRLKKKKQRLIKKIFVKDRRYLVPLRTAPYYAIKCHGNLMNTIGGIKINEHMEVMGKQGHPVPGLFAAGVDTGGWESETCCAILSGSAFGFAVNSGRIAGENANTYSAIMK